MIEDFHAAFYAEREVTVWWYFAAVGLALLAVAAVRRLVGRKQDHP